MWAIYLWSEDRCLWLFVSFIFTCLHLYLYLPHGRVDMMIERLSLLLMVNLLWIYRYFIHTNTPQTHHILKHHVKQGYENTNQYDSCVAHVCINKYFYKENKKQKKQGEGHKDQAIWSQRSNKGDREVFLTLGRSFYTLSILAI